MITNEPRTGTQCVSIEANAVTLERDKEHPVIETYDEGTHRSTLCDSCLVSFAAGRGELRRDDQSLFLSIDQSDRLYGGLIDCACLIGGHCFGR